MESDDLGAYAVEPRGNGQTPIRPVSEIDAESTGRPALRWVAVLFVVAVAAYPAMRWMGGAASAARADAGKAELQASFEHYNNGRYGQAVESAKAAIAANPN